MLRTLIFLSSIFFVIVPRAAADDDYPKHTVFAYGTEGYNVYRIPAIVRAANGDLLAFCEARVGGDASEIDLVMKRSVDLGRTWGSLRIVQDHDDYKKHFPEGQAPPITVGNPSPVVDTLDSDHPGRVWLPFTLENDRVFVTFSDDHGETWAAPREITADVKRESWGWYATGPVHAIQLQRGPHRGRLVVPVDHRLGIDGEDQGPYGAHVVYSDDHGMHWQLGGIDETYQDDLNANETTVVELNDGHLYFNTRDNNGAAVGNRGHAYSDDGGESFATTGKADYQVFEPSPAVLDAPVVQCSLLRAASTLDGDSMDLILFSGPDESGPSGKGRSDLRIRYTADETRTWKDGPLLHIGPAAYSDLVRLDGQGTKRRIGVLFESGDPGGKQNRIDFVTFSLSDFVIE